MHCTIETRYRHQQTHQQKWTAPEIGYIHHIKIIGENVVTTDVHEHADTRSDNGTYTSGQPSNPSVRLAPFDTAVTINVTINI
jgi:hypothetical protein